MITLAFDVYGTLIDTQGIQAALAETLPGERLASSISRRWREKQLEYSFRRGLMGRYQPFSVCTSQALDFVLQEANVELDDAQRQALLAAYRGLPAYPDARNLLASLSSSAARPFAFTNGEASVAANLLARAGLLDQLEGIVSVELMQTFKPSPKVYEHFLETTSAKAGQTWLISGNPFDILGARAAGWKTAWVQRSQIPFDPWGEEPDIIVTSLSDLPARLGV